MAIASLEQWIDDRQARGRYTFLRDEAVKGSGLSCEAVKKALQRLAGRKRVAKVKNYFYVIVPLEYRNAGSAPVFWFIEDLMTAMGLPYYVGLLTAAALHGSSHHQPQEFQVVTDRSVRPLAVGRARIRFFASKYVNVASTGEMKSPTGKMRVSTPETTVVDLVRFAKAAGYLDHVGTVIAELAPSLDPKRLLAAVRRVGDVPNTQRLGYILDRIRQRRLSDPIHAWLQRQEPRSVPLRSGQPAADAPEDHRWHVLVSEPLEIEA